MPRSKPAKPYAELPLTAHPAGYGCKKIRGKLHSFGKIDDSSDRSADTALQEYLKQKEDLHGGRTPRENAEALTFHTLCGKFLTTKKRMLEAGELSIHCYNDYAAVCKRVIKVFGKARLVNDLRPDDFEKLRTTMARKWGPVRVGNEINRTRIVLNYAWKSGLLEKPMLYGEGFKRPSRKKLRQHRQAQGPRMFEAVEIRSLLGLPPWRPADSVPLTAMILLGVNCGFGNADVGTLPLSALDLAGGWINFSRPKTAIERRCPLWPETVAALREWLAVRPLAKLSEHQQLVFLTAKGGSWAKETSDNPVSKPGQEVLVRAVLETDDPVVHGLPADKQAVGDLLDGLALIEPQEGLCPDQFLGSRGGRGDTSEGFPVVGPEMKSSHGPPP